mmetsp:Transcript_130486/g.363604  ORF Transcript_130486/g.363604 Transcript_130486/m.363604 type:complete len:553 (-) Transcript_130486:756-2414(-)
MLAVSDRHLQLGDLHARVGEPGLQLLQRLRLGGHALGLLLPRDDEEAHLVHPAVELLVLLRDALAERVGLLHGHLVHLSLGEGLDGLLHLLHLGLHRADLLGRLVHLRCLLAGLGVLTELAELRRCRVDALRLPAELLGGGLGEALLELPDLKVLRGDVVARLRDGAGYRSGCGLGLLEGLGGLLDRQELQAFQERQLRLVHPFHRRLDLLGLPLALPRVCLGEHPLPLVLRGREHGVQPLLRLLGPLRELLQGRLEGGDRPGHLRLQAREGGLEHLLGADHRGAHDLDLLVRELRAFRGARQLGDLLDLLLGLLDAHLLLQQDGLALDQLGPHLGALPLLRHLRLRRLEAPLQLRDGRREVALRVFLLGRDDLPGLEAGLGRLLLGRRGLLQRLLQRLGRHVLDGLGGEDLRNLDEHLGLVLGQRHGLHQVREPGRHLPVQGLALEGCQLPASSLCALQELRELLRGGLCDVLGLLGRLRHLVPDEDLGVVDGALRLARCGLAVADGLGRLLVRQDLDPFQEGHLRLLALRQRLLRGVQLLPGSHHHLMQG